MQIIPLDSTGARRITVGLYDFRTYWTPLEKMWHLDLFDASGSVIALGLALVPDINILRYDESLVATVGDLRVADLSGEGNANNSSLGNTAVLAYWAPGEFSAEYPDFEGDELRQINVDIDELFTVD